MGYSIEHLCDKFHLVRLGKTHEKYGDPYDVSFILEEKDAITVHIKGASGKISEIKQIFKWARLCGYEYLCWERLKDGKIKEVCVKLTENTS